MIDQASRVRLARHARLRDDPRTGKPILLAPERGLELNPTGAQIVRLCGEERAVADIVERLVGEGDGETARARIEEEVLSFLRALEERGLLVARPS
jgi:pyrroloquinoline quinone biosynthesis protein D